MGRREADENNTCKVVLTLYSNSRFVHCSSFDSAEALEFRQCPTDCYGKVRVCSEHS
jgi:hypothetical protein